jgi:hypothetical protein
MCDPIQCPVSEVRDTSQQPLTRTSETEGHQQLYDYNNSMILVPLFDLKFLTEFAAGGAGTRISS